MVEAALSRSRAAALLCAAAAVAAVSGAGCAGAEAMAGPQAAGGPAAAEPDLRVGLHPGESMAFEVQLAGVLVGEVRDG